MNLELPDDAGTGGDGKPLAGLTVVEHADGVAAQYCGRLLAVLGATVIKVEPPEGCSLRREPPFLAQEPPRGVLYEYLNVEKLAVTCRLDEAQGRADFRALLETADVLLDDTPVLARAALGLAPERVRDDHPRLIYVSVLPFGAVGEHAGYLAEELNLFHAGGEGYLMPNGLALEMFPDRPPVKIYGHFSEFIGGTSALCATVAAAIAQPEAGGQFVDVSVQDANISVGCFAVQRFGDGVLETRHARSFKYGGVLACADGFVELLVLEQHQWLGLVELMGTPDWVRPAFADPLERGRCGQEINEHIRRWARTQTVESLVKRGQASNVPIAPYSDTADVLGSAHAKARNTFSEVVLSGGMPARVFTAPFQFQGQPLSVARAAGAPGANNEQVWNRLVGRDRLSDDALAVPAQPAADTR